MSSMSTDSNDNPDYQSDDDLSVDENLHTKDEEEAPKKGDSTFADLSNLDEVGLDNTNRGKSRSSAGTGRWKRLRTFYRDEYHAIFQESVLDRDDGVPPVILPASQVGAVTWQSDEKRKFFSALSRNGRLAVPEIAEAVGSKSQLEVQDYLAFLREREAERHLFEKETKSISHADVPAAVEVSKECESALEYAADALAAFQDRYDQAVGGQTHAETWTINRDSAHAFDLQADENEAAFSDEDSAPSPDSLPAGGLFQLSTWIELTERLFMNPGPPHLDENWRHLALDTEQPAITRAALADFHDLVLDVLRRIVQASIFMATSRIRSSQSSNYMPQRLLKKQDVFAAVDVLKMKRGYWGYWTKVAQRNNLIVINDPHGKGRRGRQVLSDNQVENFLWERPTRSRGRRSISLNTLDSFSTAGSDSNDVEDQDRSVIETKGNVTSGCRSGSPSKSANGGEDMDAEDTSESSTGEGYEAEDVRDHTSFRTSSSRQEAQRIDLEYQQDTYLEELDNLKAREEEGRLWQILGQDPPRQVDTETTLGKRPNVLRKTMDDMKDWRSAFQPEWEAFDSALPEEDFQQSGRQRKKRKIGSQSDNAAAGDFLNQVAHTISVRGRRQ